MTSQASDSSESLGLDGTLMTAIDDQATQEDYSVSDGTTTSSSDAESAARWIRDPSTVDPSRWPHSPSVEWLPESGTVEPWPQSPSEWVQEPSIREPFRAPLPTSTGFHSGSPTAPVTHHPPSIWEPPPRTASPSSLEQDYFPYEVAPASFDHVAGNAVDFHQSVRTGSAGADQTARPRGRPTSRSSKSDEKPSVKSDCFFGPLGGRSWQMSIVNEPQTQARAPSNLAPPSTKPHSNVSKSADGGRARRPSKPPPSTVDAEALPGANAMSEIWPLYIMHTLAEDKETVAAWNSDLDAILIFAALFSAVLTTFIIESYTNLQADPTVELLQAILFELQAIRNASTAPASPMRQFQVAASAFRVNLYWFTSLILSLATALITILAKQWVNYLLAGLSPTPATRARHRQYRIDGMHRWNLPAVLSFLPVLLHVALLLFFAGLVDFVWDVNRSIAVFSAVLVCTTCIVYIIANVLAYIYPDCPFKTSVSVVFSLIINFLVIAYGKTCVAVVKTGRASSRLWARGVLACNSLYRRWRHRRLRRRLGGSLFGQGQVDPLSRVGTITAVSTTRNYESLRIASLRSQDEQFIEENKTVIDTRILLWLMRNADREDELEKLCHAITHFPHLVAHRQLFIQQGGLLFLERLLQNAVSGLKYSKLSKERRDTATSAMYALAVLESEVDTARLQDRTGLLDHEDGVATSARPDDTPYLMVKATNNPARSPLSPSIYPIIVSFLHEGGNLPISTMASALRLCVRIPDTTAQRGRMQPINALALEFLRRVTQLQSSPEMHSDINYAVNTVVYLALHDVSYRQRDGFLLPCIGDAPYWLNYLSDLMSRPFATADARHQMCRAVCAIAQSRGSAAEVVNPRVPRHIDIQTYARRLTGLISCDRKPDVLTAALVAFEGLLWTATSEERGDVAYIAHLLTPAHLAFTAQIQRRLKLNPENVSEVAKITPSITHISVYLSIYHPVKENTLRIALLQNVFWILAHLLKASQRVSTPLCMDAHVLKGRSPQTTVTRRLRGNEATRWIYRAASRMITLFLNLGGKTTGDAPSATIDPQDFVFSDIAVSTPAGAALTLALQNIVGRTTMADASGSTMDPLILDSFAIILTDAFFRGMPDTLSRDAGAWDWEATRIVAHIAGRGGLSALLTVSSYNTTARLSALSMALRTIRMVLHVDTGSSKERPAWMRIPRHWHSQSHSANVLAAMFRDQYAAFCLRLTEMTQVGEPMRHPDMEGALVDFIRLSGNLAFFSAPRHADSPDPPVISTLLPFLACLTDYAPGPTLFMARRHAWGALGSIATLYTLTAEELRDDRNPERHFRFDAFRADDIAAGLLRALVFSSIKDGPDTEPHCGRCHFGHREYIRLLFRWAGHTLPDAYVTHKVFINITTIALKAIAALWKTEDPESIELRESLRRHGLSSRLRPFLEGSDMTELANELMTEVFDAERHASRQP